MRALPSRDASPSARTLTRAVVLSRPEKDHAAQLHAFHRLCADHPALGARLVLLGGSRNADDAARVAALRDLARELGLEVRVHSRTRARGSGWPPTYFPPVRRASSLW